MRFVPQWFIKAFDKEPAMVIAAVLGGVAVTIPIVVVPIRRSLGLATYQWDADPRTHPVCINEWIFLHYVAKYLLEYVNFPSISTLQFISYYGNNFKQYSFDDGQLLNSWSKHDQYAYQKERQPIDPNSVDYPEARQRLKEKRRIQLTS